MARVLLTGSLCRQLARGQAQLDVKSVTVRRLILELGRRFPGLGRQIEESTAIAIDGGICQDASSEPWLDPEHRQPRSLRTTVR